MENALTLHLSYEIVTNVKKVSKAYWKGDRFNREVAHASAPRYTRNVQSLKPKATGKIRGLMSATRFY
jgi:hypothetical protein